MGADETRTQALINDALIMAQSLKFDVMNCLTLQDNSCLLDVLKFGKGDGELNYYMYNYRCRDVPSKDLGLVML